MSRTDWCECPGPPGTSPASEPDVDDLRALGGVVVDLLVRRGSRGSRRTSARPAAARRAPSRPPARPCPARRSRTRRSGRGSARGTSTRPQSSRGRRRARRAAARARPARRARRRRRRPAAAARCGAERCSGGSASTSSIGARAQRARAARSSRVASSSTAALVLVRRRRAGVEAVQRVSVRGSVVRLHERDAAPLDRVGDDQPSAAARPAKRRERLARTRCRSWPSQRRHRPAERARPSPRGRRGR